MMQIYDESMLLWVNLDSYTTITILSRQTYLK